MFLKSLVLSSIRPWLRTMIVVTRDFRHFRSFSEGARGPQGQPWPWFSYAAIFYLQRLDLSQCRVLEFGSGGSTAFWSKEARDVVSIETNRTWYDRVKPSVPANGKLLYFSETDWEACRAQVTAEGPFDLVIIDGAWRKECAASCLEWVKPTGLVVLDNPDWYPKAHLAMACHDLLEVTFTGLTPLYAYSSTTAVYLQRGFSIPFKKSSRLSDLPGSYLQNHEDEPAS